MPRRKVTEMVRYLRQLVDPENTSGLSDAELLERYVHGHDEVAFELLLWRHGLLVFNVCRRLLPREQDAEDAFQATFLAFVRKAHAIARRGSVSSWLYKVAYRLALEVRERARKTDAQEKPGAEALAVQSASDPVWSDLRPILDEELSRLPERLRRPIVLCHLEGKSNEEAARELGCRLGTIYSRLSRGRELLRRRLLHRGVTLSAAVLTAALAEHAAETTSAIPVVRTAVRPARTFAGLSSGGPISPRATALAEGVLRTMFVTKLKIATAILVAVGMIGLGTGVFTYTTWGAEQDVAKDKVTAVPSSQALTAKVKGEWSYTASRNEAKDSEIVWTFRPNGVFRIDAVDRETRKQVRGMVGLWRVEEGDLRLVEEVWNDKKLRPAQTRERLRVQSISESELILQVLERNGRRVGDMRQLRFKRFAGWDRKPPAAREVGKEIKSLFKRFAGWDWKPGGKDEQ